LLEILPVCYGSLATQELTPAVFRLSDIIILEGSGFALE